MNSERKNLINKLLIQLHKMKQDGVKSKVNFWQLFYEYQKIIDKETLQCLVILNGLYEDMLMTARKGDYESSIKKLKNADAVKNKFEMNGHVDSLFKIMSYPNIAYLRYKMDDIRSAMYYTRRTVNLIKKNNYQDPVLLFRIGQQEINYAKLYFEKNEVSKGINHSLESILQCFRVVDKGVLNNNYSPDIEKDIVNLHKTNITVLAEMVINAIENQSNKISNCLAIRWNLVKEFNNQAIA